MIIGNLQQVKSIKLVVSFVFFKKKKVSGYGYILTARYSMYLLTCKKAFHLFTFTSTFYISGVFLLHDAGV